ncbi:GNAT family N-acetyltransferase [Oleisolibacter albus]|uniref:GNAT family N-acetyltransferase n=1 Tax=Oleisolibacter albus TaxID=2171757 RepID=UPI000DF14A3F|nr:GNAT family N-acetyltransferase [Oleisolibacter albus]
MALAAPLSAPLPPVLLRTDIRFPADAEAAAWLQREMGRLEQAALGVQRRPLGLLVRDDSGRLVGGALCVVWATDLYLHLLWVDGTRRGGGIGAALMTALDRAALERGCRRIYVNTMGFQGPGFYPRFGYRAEGVLRDFVHGQDRHYFRKEIGQPLPARGLPPGLALEITDQPSKADEQIIDDGLTAHWLRHIPEQYQELSTVLHDGDTALAGLHGIVDGDAFTITDLFVEPAWRGRRLARRLLAETHAHVAHLGCRRSTVMAMDYQAPDLFRHLGFTPALRVDDYLLGRGRTWLRTELGSVA